MECLKIFLILLIAYMSLIIGMEMWTLARQKGVIKL